MRFCDHDETVQVRAMQGGGTLIMKRCRNCSAVAYGYDSGFGPEPIVKLPPWVVSLA
jgi:hypothetical protein